MAEPENEQERPCLHCIMVELIDDFFAEYPPATGRSDKVDTSHRRGRKESRRTDKPAGWVIRQQVIEPAKHALRRRVSPKRRPPQSALAQGTDGGSDRVEYGTILTPSPAWTRVVALVAARRRCPGSVAADYGGSREGGDEDLTGQADRPRNKRAAPWVPLFCRALTCHDSKHSDIYCVSIWYSSR